MEPTSSHSIVLGSSKERSAKLNEAWAAKRIRRNNRRKAKEKVRGLSWGERGRALCGEDLSTN